MLTRSPSSSRAIPACFSLQFVNSHFRWGRLCRHTLTCRTLMLLVAAGCLTFV